MDLLLPAALRCADDHEAVVLLCRYYLGADGALPYRGSRFDNWDSLGRLAGRRVVSDDRFTADDVVAVGFLNVQVPADAVVDLLVTRAAWFGELLAAIGPDRDLADVEDGQIDSDWPAWRAHTALRDLPGVGPTIAGKLLARKRPRLVPVYDQVVREVTGCKGVYWEPLRRALRHDDKALQHRLLRLRDAAGLPAAVSALRVFDVITWMTGSDAGRVATRRPVGPGRWPARAETRR